MNKKQIINFIRKVFKKEIADGKMFDVIYKMDDNDICECEIEIFRNHNNVNMAFILGINKKTFAKKKNKTWCYCIILHEIGHFITSKGKASGRNEYLAHKWAYEKAQELNLKNVMKVLKESIIEWKDFTEKTYRIYRNAFNIALKENFINA